MAKKATTYFLVYVDDVILIASPMEFISNMITNLAKEFAIKDLGALHYFLGIHVTPMPKGGMFLSQHQYIANLLQSLNLSNLKSATTLMDCRLDLSQKSELLNELKAIYFQQMIGSMQYNTTIY